MDGYQQRVGEGKMGKKVKGIRSIHGVGKMVEE